MDMGLANHNPSHPNEAPCSMEWFSTQNKSSLTPPRSGAPPLATERPHKSSLWRGAGSSNPLPPAERVSKLSVPVYNRREGTARQSGVTNTAHRAFLYRQALLYRCFVETEPTPMVAIPDWPQLLEMTRQRWVRMATLLSNRLPTPVNSDNAQSR